MRIGTSYGLKCEMTASDISARCAEWDENSHQQWCTALCGVTCRWAGDSWYCYTTFNDWALLFSPVMVVKLLYQLRWSGHQGGMFFIQCINTYMCKWMGCMMICLVTGERLNGLHVTSFRVWLATWSLPLTTSSPRDRVPWSSGVGPPFWRVAIPGIRPQ